MRVITVVSLDFGPAENRIASNSPHGATPTRESLTTFTPSAAVQQSARFFPLCSYLISTVIQLSVIESLSVLGRAVSLMLCDTQLPLSDCIVSAELLL